LIVIVPLLAQPPVAVVELWSLGVAPRFMKIRHVALVVIGFATVLFASSVVPYDNSKPPSLSLPAAYEVATTALGSATNQFHCISAAIQTDAIVSPHGGWFFTFCSTNKPPISKFVTVEFSGKVHVEAFMRDE
jgi:hypothetical protein